MSFSYPDGPQVYCARASATIVSVSVRPRLRSGTVSGLKAAPGRAPDRAAVALFSIIGNLAGVVAVTVRNHSLRPFITQWLISGSQPYFLRRGIQVMMTTHMLC